MMVQSYEKTVKNYSKYVILPYIELMSYVSFSYKQTICMIINYD